MKVKKMATRFVGLFAITLVLVITFTILHGYSTVKAVTNSTFSGVITDQYNNPISNADITLANGPNGAIEGSTDSSGYFSISAVPGNYNLWVYGDSVDGMMLYAPYAPNTIDLSSNLVQNLQLSIARIHISVEDYDGNPLAGVEVKAHGEGWTNYFSGYDVDEQALTQTPLTTDLDGNIEFNTLIGQTYISGTNIGHSLCATYQSTFICLKDSLTVTSDTNVVLRQDLPAPADLAASTPTHTPVLTWNSSNGATSYNIYRDVNQGPYSKIDSTTSTNYTDSSLPDGNYQYYVTATNSIQESFASNPISVTVDNTNPTITYTLSAPLSIYGWNDSSVTVTFNCNDSGSGVSSCTLPVTLSSEAANQNVTGTAIDNMGNTSSITATVNIDLTNPLVSNLQLSNSKKTGVLSISASTSDSLSGIASGEFYIDTDPGIGNGVPMNYSAGQLSSQTNTNALGKGLHTIYVRSQDKAGNWSTVVYGSVRI